MIAMAKNILKMKTACAYIRVSTDKQEELSPDAQKRLLIDYAKKNNVSLLADNIYIDNGISGKKADKRPEFMKMIGLAKSKEHPFDIVLVWKFSRFARNQEESIVYKSLLKKNDVDVVSVSEPLVDGPFDAGSSAQTLKCAVKTSDSTNVGGADWNLIYGSGGTSYTSVRVGIIDDEGNVAKKDTIKLYDSEIKVSDFQHNEGQNSWSRKLSYDKDGIKFEIQQNVKVAAKTANEQYYEISYQFKNKGDKNLSVDFMYNCDTAYNNNDHCEGYFVNNQRVSKSMLYTSDSNYTSQGNSNVKNSIPSSFSIFNQQSALQFTEKICIDNANRPDTLSLGRWTQVDQWSYYDNLNEKLGKDLGTGSYGRDLAFSMIWSDRVVNAGQSQTFGLKQGMAASATDSNVSALPVTLNSERLTRHDTYNSLWVQSGANSGEDLELIFEEMNCDTIGLRGSAVDPIEKAIEAMNEVEEALKSVNANRSKIGAQQNRLEYTVQHEMNYSENLTSAESSIRDTDMAKEMVALSKNSILEQAAQSMISQANQQNQGILQLIQS